MNFTALLQVLTCTLLLELLNLRIVNKISIISYNPLPNDDYGKGYEAIGLVL
jgi:hypothetical protein